MYVVEIGNGSAVFGPFPSRTQAEAYAQRVRHSGRWAGFTVMVLVLRMPE